MMNRLALWIEHSVLQSDINARLHGIGFQERANELASPILTRSSQGKIHLSLAIKEHNLPEVHSLPCRRLWRDMMNIVAIALFIALFVFGRQVFGWHDESHKVQMALVASFVMGYFSGFRRAR